MTVVDPPLTLLTLDDLEAGHHRVDEAVAGSRRRQGHVADRRRLRHGRSSAENGRESH